MGALYESYFLLLTSDIIFSLINKGSITSGSALLGFPYLIQISYLLENQRGFKKRGDSPTTFPQQFQLL